MPEEDEAVGVVLVVVVRKPDGVATRFAVDVGGDGLAVVESGTFAAAGGGSGGGDEGEGGEEEEEKGGEAGVKACHFRRLA